MHMFISLFTMHLSFLLLIFAIKCEYFDDEIQSYSCSHGKYENTQVHVDNNFNDLLFNCHDINNREFIIETQTVKEYLFYGSNVQNVKLTSSVTAIGKGSFAFCPFLSLKVDSPSSIKQIDVGAFYKSALTLDKELSLSLTSLGSHAFYYVNGNTNKLTVTMDSTVPESAFDHFGGQLTVNLNKPKNDNTYIIDQSAFSHSSISSIVIPACVNSIGSYAFESCKLTKFEFQNDNKTTQTIQSAAFFKCTFPSGIIKFASTVISIGSGAFADAVIEGVYIEGRPSKTDNGFNKISELAFYGSSIKSLEFGNFHTEFKTNSFGKCQNLKSIKFGKLTEIPDYAFQEDLVEGGITLVIPATMTTLGEGAFKYCTGITTVTFDANSQITEIPDYLFYECSQLTTINNEPTLLDSIGTESFYNCRNLQGFKINEGVTQIYDKSFMNCESFTSSISLPNTLKYLGNSAFEGCKQMTSNNGLIFSYNVIYIGERAFYGCSGLTGRLQIFCKLDKDNTGDINQPSNFKANTIPKEAFYGCSNLNGDLFLQRGITKIEEGAFYDCSSLTGELPPTITTIGKKAFYRCSSLSGQIPESATVNEYSFYECRQLTGPVKITATNGVPKYAFYNCQGLTSLNFATVPTIYNDYCFYGCSGLQGELDVSTFRKVGKYAFAKCSGLTGPLTFGKFNSNPPNPSTLTIDDYAFQGCSGFSNTLSFDITGTGNAYIGRNAFEGCTGFKDGTLSFVILSKEETEINNNNGMISFAPYHRFNYFLKICNNAFEDTKFKNIYYLGRFEPDCDYDIGISKIKGIHTSSNYVNKSFCNYPLHKNSLSGGAIAGIVIACVVVVAAIVVLIVFLILRNKKNKDKSEAEVEMNQDP